MSAKMGRPPIENPKGFNLKVRLDKEAEDRLREYCFEKGISMSDAVRIALEKLLSEK